MWLMLQSFLGKEAVTSEHHLHHVYLAVQSHVLVGPICLSSFNHISFLIFRMKWISSLVLGTELQQRIYSLRCVCGEARVVCGRNTTHERTHAHTHAHTHTHTHTHAHTVPCSLYV